MRNAIETLRSEHQTILAVMARLEAKARSSVDGKLPRSYVEAAIEFIHAYVDGNHHEKEERVLFVTMTDDPWLSRIADTMAFDHDDGRMLTGAIERALKTDRPVCQPILDYVAFIRDHIRREDEVIFETVEHSLDPALLANLDLKFEEIELAALDRGELARLLLRLGVDYVGARQ
jgi:hemerythrin-like domain-containing protein